MRALSNSREAPAQLPRRGLYLGRRLPDDSRYGRYLTGRPGGYQANFLPPTVSGINLIIILVKAKEAEDLEDTQ